MMPLYEEQRIIASLVGSGSLAEFITDLQTLPEGSNLYDLRVECSMSVNGPISWSGTLSFPEPAEEAPTEEETT